MKMTHLCPHGAYFLVMETTHWYIIQCQVAVNRVEDREEQGDRGGGLFFIKEDGKGRPLWANIREQKWGDSEQQKYLGARHLAPRSRAAGTGWGGSGERPSKASSSGVSLPPAPNTPLFGWSGRLLTPDTHWRGPMPLSYCLFQTIRMELGLVFAACSLRSRS